MLLGAVLMYFATGVYIATLAALATYAWVGGEEGPKWHEYVIGFLIHAVIWPVSIAMLIAE